MILRISENLKTEVTYNNRSASDVTDRAVFANRYDASTEVTGGTKADISAKKTLHGRNMRAGEFQFKLTTRPADGATVQYCRKSRMERMEALHLTPSAIRPRIQQPEQVQ